MIQIDRSELSGAIRHPLLKMTALFTIMTIILTVVAIVNAEFRYLLIMSVVGAAASGIYGYMFWLDTPLFIVSDDDDDESVDAEQ